MPTLYELQGPLFDKAVSRMESGGPRNDYTASAVYAAEGYFYAAYAAPGWVPEFVRGRDGPAVFRDHKDAEASAREMLFNHLNANLENGWIDGLRAPN